MASTQTLPIGAQVQLEVRLGGAPVIMEGEVFAYDANTDRFVLRQAGSTPFHNNLRILKGSHVSRILELAPPGDCAKHLPALDLERCREREERAVRAAEVEAAKIGVGVGRQAQAVFDALAKTLPCRWDQDKIIVLDEILIAPPYEKCTSLHNDAAAAARVQKVLDAERLRIQA